MTPRRPSLRPHLATTRRWGFSPWQRSWETCSKRGYRPRLAAFSTFFKTCCPEIDPRSPFENQTAKSTCVSQVLFVCPCQQGCPPYSAALIVPRLRTAPLRVARAPSQEPVPQNHLTSPIKCAMMKSAKNGERDDPARQSKTRDGAGGAACGATTVAPSPR